MPDPTAGHSANIDFVTGTSTAGTSTTGATTFAAPVGVGFDWMYFQKYLSALPRLAPHITQPESQLAGIPTNAAPWLSAVQRRLNASIGTPSNAAQGGGAWLSKDVVMTANLLFEAASSLLPGEPYLYGSRNGDLVAEFKNDVGSMTMIVTKDAAIVFAVIGDETIHKTVSLNPIAPAVLASELSAITSRLNTVQHGQVDTGR